ncbi:RNA polymerase sigma factor [Cryptosporangium sp. NPDC051539]|uniref:RNA polymerase sigma factor n=1 Tax=Cryptosporangium sp. NPDC051539 TaxID=3363962 RepID=UPI0037BA358A
MPPAEREALVLCVWSGVSYADAAAVLGITEASVRSRVSRAGAHLSRDATGLDVLFYGPGGHLRCGYRADSPVVRVGESGSLPPTWLGMPVNYDGGDSGNRIREVLRPGSAVRHPGTARRGREVGHRSGGERGRRAAGEMRRGDPLEIATAE